MSRESQRNALLIQHCYSPYRTTQFEKTIKKRQKGPVLAIKGPFGDLGGPDLVPTAPHWPAWVGLMVTTHFDLVLGPFWVPPGAQKGLILAQISMAPYLSWYCMVLHRLHGAVQLIWRAGELPRSASSHFLLLSCLWFHPPPG